MSQPFDSYVAKDRRCGPFTFDMLIADEIGQSWYDCSVDQFMPERQWCLDHIRPGFTILDCGSHHGIMSVLFALKTGPRGRVFAWDALPQNAAMVRQNAALNRCTNVIAYGHALGEKSATVQYRQNAGNVMVGSESTDGGCSSSIEVVRLDDDIEPGLHVDFLKLDVEGSELAVLRGATTVLRQRPIIDLELHNFAFADRVGTLNAIFEILGQYNYCYEVLGEVFGKFVNVGAPMDTAWLAQFDNPHVFCTASIPPTEAALLAELNAVYRSTSWRLTAPLRGLKRLIR